MSSNQSNMTIAFRESSDVDLAGGVLYIRHPEALLHFSLACCVIFIVIGIPGNLITVIALATYKKFQNATALFIINLHISNLLFCCIVLPVTAHSLATRQLTLGNTICKVFPLMKYALNSTEQYLVMAITINRYVLVCHPKLYSKLYGGKKIIISITSVWVAAFGLFLPGVFGLWGQYGFDIQEGKCTMLADKNNNNPKVLLFSTAFILPCLCIIICYGRIWWVVRKKTVQSNVNNISMKTLSTNVESDPSTAENKRVTFELSAPENSADDNIKRRDGQENSFGNFLQDSLKRIRKDKLLLPTRKDKRLATITVAITASFILCHLPIMIIRIGFQNNIIPSCKIIANLLDFASVFLNPIIYVVMSKEYRQAYKNIFGSLKNKVTKLF